jgi:MFS family permease
MRGTLRLGTVLIVIGSVCFLFLNPESSPALAGVGSGVMGFGMGLLTVTSVILIQGSVPWSRRGSATASNVFARNLGSTLGAAILGSVLNYGLRNAGGAGNAGVSPEGIRQLLEKPVSGPERQVLQAALDHSLHLTFWCVVAMAVLTAALALFIPSRNLEDLSGGAKG